MSEQGYQSYICPLCTASCTFEAMAWCEQAPNECPVFVGLESGEIVDRRPTDLDPNFPSEFSIKSIQGVSP